MTVPDDDEGRPLPHQEKAPHDSTRSLAKETHRHPTTTDCPGITAAAQLLHLERGGPEPDLDDAELVEPLCTCGGREWSRG